MIDAARTRQLITPNWPLRMMQQATRVVLGAGDTTQSGHLCVARHLVVGQALVGEQCPPLTFLDAIAPVSCAAAASRPRRSSNFSIGMEASARRSKRN